MPWNCIVEYPFTAFSVKENAPAESGVYALCESDRWIYIGEASDIQKSLLVHLNDDKGNLGALSPTTFSFELWPEQQRAVRCRELIQELQPAVSLDKLCPAEANYGFKRSSVRHQIDFPVEVLSPTIEGYASGRGIVLGTKGMAICAPAALNVGDPVELQFTLPHSQVPLQAKGIIRNAHGFKFGIEFQIIPATHIAEIKRICQILAMQQ